VNFLDLRSRRVAFKGSETRRAAKGDVYGEMAELRGKLRAEVSSPSRNPPVHIIYFLGPYSGRVALVGPEMRRVAKGDVYVEMAVLCGEVHIDLSAPEHHPRSNNIYPYYP
jgi:hypothetical protein